MNTSIRCYASHTLRLLLPIIFGFMALSLTSYVVHAQTIDVLHNFIASSGSIPYSPLIQGTDGYFYGTTCSGGAYANGTLYKYDNTTRTVTILHNFQDTSNTIDGAYDGAYPYAAVIQATDGNLYGTTLHGGPKGYGTIYKYNIKTGVYTVLHRFLDGSVNGDGIFPYAALIQGSDGYLYGTTVDTIYRYSINQDNYTILHKLNNSSVKNDVAGSYSSLIQASDGNLYATTTRSGSAGYGTIYKYNIATGNVTILHNFQDGSVINDGANPYASMIEIDGNFYGTTSAGGSKGKGALFKYNIATGNLVILHNFCDGTVNDDGWCPYATLIKAANGNLYGTTLNGGSNNGGTIYRFNTLINQYTVLHNFFDSSTTNDGGYPVASLISVSEGNLYGTTPVGGSDKNGTIFKVNTSQIALTSSLTPAAAGKSVTFKAVVTGNSPVGTVQFMIDGTNAGSSVALSGGVATYSTTGLSIGNHSIVAVYNGDTNNIGNVSNPVFQKIIAPIITSLSPSTVSGSKTFMLTVNGTNFVNGSIIKFNGTNIATTYVSATQLTASINKYYTTLASYPGSATISVINPNSAWSAGATLTISAPLPAISSLSPSSVTGATTFTLTVNGSNFVNGSIIKWNGTNMTTTYISSTQLTASINKYYDTLASYPGSAIVSVLNPDGGRSTGSAITITQPITPPAITSLSPSSVTGATTFTLTVNGTGFQSDAVIKWNGTNMTTTYVSPTQLTATIGKYYDTLSSYPGSATVSVLNPDSGRSAGSTIAITAP